MNVGAASGLWISRHMNFSTFSAFLGLLMSDLCAQALEVFIKMTPVTRGISEAPKDDSSD